MKKVKIAIQGELGAYSHIAVNNLYKDAEVKTCATFEETFKQAHEHESYKSIIPIENTVLLQKKYHSFRKGDDSYRKYSERISINKNNSENKLITK